MTNQSLLTFLPIIATVTSALVVMFAISMRGSPTLVALLSVFGLAIALTLSFFDFSGHTLLLSTPLLVMDPYGLFMTQLILVLAMVIMIFAYDYWQKQSIAPHEYYLCMLLSVSGALIMVVSVHLASFFLGLELMTLPLYAAISYFTHKKASLSAGVKYLILAGTSTALLLFGMALIYAETGTMNVIHMNEQLQGGLLSFGRLFYAGFALVIVGLGFKISAVPFHLWTPDVYEGAPLPVTAYLATISKGASMALFLRLWQLISNGLLEASGLIALMALLSMIVGNLLALKEDNLKRLLAYSSIAHFGYILMAALSSGPTSLEAFLFYLSAYGITILLIFGALMSLASSTKEITKVDDLRSLWHRNKIVAGALLLGFFSLMGLPLTAIFMGKILVIMAGVESSQWLLISALVISSSIGLFVYLRLANAIFSVQEKPLLEAAKGTPWATSLLAMLAICAFFLAIWPTIITDLMPAGFERIVASE